VEHAQLPAGSLYPTALTDADGKPLEGLKARSTFTFAPGQLPLVRFFWSISMSDQADFYRITNPIDRWSIGDRTQGLRFGAEGSLTLQVQLRRMARTGVTGFQPTRPSAVHHALCRKEQRRRGICGISLFMPGSEPATRQGEPRCA